MLHQDFPKAVRSSIGPNPHIGRNLPIFGKVLIVAATRFAPSAHDLHGIENCGGDDGSPTNARHTISRTISPLDVKVSAHGPSRPRRSSASVSVTGEKLPRPRVSGTAVDDP